MSTKKSRFIKGIILAPDNVALDGVEGEIKVELSSGKLKSTLQSSAREIITDSQTQELTNKTITSPVINTGVSGTAIDTDGTLAANSDTKLASQKAIKTYVDAKVASKDEASEISYSNATSGLVATNVQTAIDEVDGNVDNLVTLTGVALDSTNLGSFTGITIPDNSTVKGALQALETELETKAESSDLLTHTGASTNVHGLAVGSSVVGTTDSQVLTNKTITGADIRTPVRSDVKQDTKANLDTYALTASNGQLVFATDDKQMYQVVDSALVAVGGSETIKLTSGEALSVGNAVYVSTGTGNDSSRTAGFLYKTDASNDDRVDVLGIVKKVYAGSAATFSEGFESGNFTTNSWNVVNGSQTNKWAVGTATSQAGTYSAYISNDSGTSNAYTGTTSVVWFYKDVAISSGQGLYFYYKLTGESSFDCGRIIIDPTVSVVPVAGTDISSVPSGGSNTTLTSTLNVWTQRFVNLSAYSGTTVRIIFGWKNDTLITNQPPIAIDAISIAGLSSADVQFSGNCTSLSGLSQGNLYYLSITPGALTTIAPSTSTTWIVPVGLSTSSTSLIINPVASGSAIYNTAADTSFIIANNISSATSITGLLFSGSTYRSFIIDYSIYRSTSTALSGVAQVGELKGVYNTQSSTWYLTDTYAGQNAGVTFTITSGGQIQYTSTNISGTSYSGTMKYDIRKTFGV